MCFHPFFIFETFSTLFTRILSFQVIGWRMVCILVVIANGSIWAAIIFEVLVIIIDSTSLFVFQLLFHFFFFLFKIIFLEDNLRWKLSISYQRFFSSQPLEEKKRCQLHLFEIKSATLKESRKHAPGEEEIVNF